MNQKWLITLVIQVVSGIMLYFFGDGEGKDMGLLLLGSSFGQGVTGNMRGRD